MNWLSNPFSKDDNRFWLEARRGALGVVAASQRNSALWLLQTTPASTIDQYIKGKNPEDRQRRQEIFGCDSITVTWTVLVALEEIFGQLPNHTSIASTLTTLYQHRSDGGGYGTATGWRTHHIFATCRHTATALLSFLQFRDSFSPPLTLAQCKESANWLLDSALPNGGWPFARQTDMGPDDEPKGFELLSTACAILALCEFLQRFTEPRDPQFIQRVETSVKSGFARLREEIGEKWSRSERSKNDIYDGAFATEMMCLALQTKILARIVPDCDSDIKGWCRSLVQLSLPYRHRAWPRNFGDASQAPCLAATLAMAGILLCERYRGTMADVCEPDQAAAIAGFLAQSIRQHTLDSKDPLDAWDWINMARVSHAILRINGRQFLTTVADKGEDAFESIHKLRSNDARSGITRQDLVVFPKFCRSTVAYILTYGRPERIASNILDKWYQARHPVIRRIVDGSIWAAVGGIAWWLWQSRSFVLNLFS